MANIFTLESELRCMAKGEDSELCLYDLDHGIFSHQMRNILKSIFSYYDRDNDGALNFNEFRRLIIGIFLKNYISYCF